MNLLRSLLFALLQGGATVVFSLLSLLTFPLAPVPRNRLLAAWARLGAELGASAIKTIYTGDVESFARVTGGCPVPILVAGGPAVGSAADLLAMAEEVVAGGGAGLAIGRRVWQAPDPAHLLLLLGGLVHSRITLAEAVGEIEAAG